jgi:hypothetical protein
MARKYQQQVGRKFIGIYAAWKENALTIFCNYLKYKSLIFFHLQLELTSG